MNTKEVKNVVASVLAGLRNSSKSSGERGTRTLDLGIMRKVIR